MPEYSSPKTQIEYDKNFAQLKPLMNETEAYYESSRCLFCHDAPCMTACPTSIDIPLFIRQINTGNLNGAAKTIYDSNTFGFSCGKVCPTEVLCEGACVYVNQDVKPLQIGRLQSHATSHAIQENKSFYTLKADNGQKIAVIGAGPAGITFACEMRKEGFAVDIFEAKAKPSGLTVYGIAPYKIGEQEALDEMDYLQNQFGYQVHYNHRIRSRADLEKLENEYDTIFLGIGLGSTGMLGIKGEQLENCWGAVEFIEQLRIKKEAAAVGKNVIVIGGGNTAMDAASESARMGAESVILAYRRSKNEMRAYDFEYDLAKGVGVTGSFNIQPLEIMGNGKVEGIKFIRTQNKNGKLVAVEGSEFVQPCDWVIKATGQRKQKAFLSLIPNLDLDAKGRVLVDAQSRCTNPKYFAAGDVVNGGVEVVNAVAEAKLAAEGACSLLL